MGLAAVRYAQYAVKARLSLASGVYRRGKNDSKLASQRVAVGLPIERHVVQFVLRFWEGSVWPVKVECRGRAYSVMNTSTVFVLFSSHPMSVQGPGHARGLYHRVEAVPPQRCVGSRCFARQWLQGG
eukprot:9001076-Lingulodinium_polyedra.AAC.1